MSKKKIPGKEKINRKVRVMILILDKVEFKAKSIQCQKISQILLLKIINHNYDRTIIHIYKKLTDCSPLYVAKSKKKNNRKNNIMRLTIKKIQEDIKRKI